MTWNNKDAINDSCFFILKHCFYLFHKEHFSLKKCDVLVLIFFIHIKL